MSLDQVTKELGEHHAALAKEKAALAESREKFFALATETLEEKNLARLVAKVPAETSVDEYVGKYHPGYRIVEQDGDQVILEEDPAYLPFVYVNPITGKKYERNVVQPQPLLDDETLAWEDPDLWFRVSDIPEPWDGILRELLAEVGGDYPAEIDDLLKDTSIPRIVKAPEDIDLDDLTALTPYFVPAPISLKLEPPRKAKPEDQ